MPIINEVCAYDPPGRLVSQKKYFIKAVLKSPAANVPVWLYEAANVGQNSKIVIEKLGIEVDGATAWTGALTAVNIQDTAETPVVQASVLLASLVGNAIYHEHSVEVVQEVGMRRFDGATMGKGLQVVANDVAATGSDIIVSAAIMVVEYDPYPTE